MNYYKKIQITLVLLTICSSTVFGADTDKRQNNGKHRGPPPEAYTSCADKAIGDTAQFVNKRGKTISGTCMQKGEVLVLRPKRTKGNTGGKKPRRGPPPEAYTSCADKAIGDIAQFVNPRGNTVSGTCEQKGDVLVLRPKHPMRNSGYKQP